MAGQVKIGAVVYAFKLFKAHREFIFNIVGVFCIVSKLIRAMLMPAQLIHADTVLFVERPPLFTPVVEPFVVGTGLYKKLHFHLLKLAGTEDKVFRYNFVSECLTDLRNTERDFHTVGLRNVFIVHVDTLCGFGA